MGSRSANGNTGETLYFRALWIAICGVQAAARKHKSDFITRLHPLERAREVLQHEEEVEDKHRDAEALGQLPLVQDDRADDERDHGEEDEQRHEERRRGDAHEVAAHDAVVRLELGRALVDAEDDPAHPPHHSQT